MTAEEEGRAIALKKYKVLELLMELLSVGLLTIGVIAVIEFSESGSGPPYYIGCFVVGCLIKGHYFLSMLLVMGCFGGTTLTGIGGLGGDYSNDNQTGYEDKVKTLSGVTIAVCVLALGTNVFGMCIVCTYGSYFSVHILDPRRGRTVITYGTIGTGANTTFVTQTEDANEHGVGTNANIQTLQEQNRLLQENLRLQQEIFKQQQQEAQLGLNYPPPDRSFPADAPPSYHAV